MIALVSLLFAASNFAAPPVRQQQPVNDTATFAGHGTPLFMEVRGRADRAPIILYLHGGPGSALGIVAFRAYVGPALESAALVAYLHQRGVMRSPDVADSTQTIENHIADADSAVAYLARRYPGRPIFLLGHSWGGLLATKVAAGRPAHVAGVILVSAPFDMASNERASYDATLAWARRVHNDTAVKALSDLGAPPYQALEQQLVLSQWSSSANGGIGAHIDPARLFGRAPYTAPDSMWSVGEMRIAGAMLRELEQASTIDQLRGIKLPLLLIDGARDPIVPESDLRRGYALWGGPKSEVVLAKSHHLPFVDEPDRFTRAVINFIRAKE
ncbi:MAG: alpha/beta fold hydrolase [Gemmatimonadales bacterium]